MLGFDKVVLGQVVKRLPPKMRGKVPRTHLQLVPSFLDLLKDEPGVEGFAQATVKDCFTALKDENKTLPQLVVVLVDAKIVEQLLAVQLRKTTHNELKIFANVLKLPVNIELVKVEAVILHGNGVVFVTHVLR